MPTNLKNFKEEKRATLLRTHSLAKTTRSVAILYISDETLRAFLKEAGQSIEVAFVDDTKDNREGADVFITDNWDLSPTEELLSSVVVPIGPKEGAESNKLTEFNPMKFEGNAFLYEKIDKFQMFAALVRYLENVKYPGDKRTLLKNLAGEK